MRIQPKECLQGILLALLVGMGPTARAESGKAPAGAPRLAVLDLVDVGDGKRRSMVTDTLRLKIEAGGRWSLIPADSAARSLKELNFDPAAPCNAAQCSFDAGNILQAEYVLFGTVAELDKHFSYTLKLMHVPSAQVVWTEVRECRAGTLMERSPRLNKAFAETASRLDPQAIDLNMPASKSSLALLDLSHASLQSAALHERVSTYIFENRGYEVMSHAEQEELLKALEINKYSVVPSKENMVNLGEKLGVSHLLYFRLYKEGSEYIYLLSMYDVEAKEQVLQLPARPSVDITQLFDYEREFFSELKSKSQRGQEGAKPDKVAKSIGRANSTLWISLAVLGLGGGAAAYWSISAREEASAWDPGKPPQPPSDKTK